MKKRKTRKKKNTPSPAQLRAREKFVKMVRARARSKKQKADKRAKNSLLSIKKIKECQTSRLTGKEHCREVANPRRRRNTTVIKAKRVKVMATNPRSRKNAVAIPALTSSLKTQYDLKGLRTQRDRLRTNIQTYQTLTRQLTKELKATKDSGRARDLGNRLAEIERLESREVSQLDGVLRRLGYAGGIRKPKRNPESWRKILVSKLRARRSAGESSDIRALARLQRGKRKLKESRRIVRKYTKRNPGVTTKSKATRKLFTGMKSRRTITPLAPRGTPKSVAILGKLVKIRTRSRTFTPPKKKGRNPEPDIFLAADDRGNLHIVGDPLPVLPGPARDLGEIVELDYATRKPHLGYDETTEFFHELGEEGGRRPHLVTDAEGHLKIAGGDYYIERDGIHD